MTLLQIAAIIVIAWAVFRLAIALIRFMVATMSATLKEMGVTDTMEPHQKLVLWWWMTVRKKRIRAFEVAVDEGRTARAAYEKAQTS